MSTRAWAYLLLFIAVFATAWQLLRYPQDPAPIRVAVLVETPLRRPLRVVLSCSWSAIRAGPLGVR
ncbi:MAG: hypothetical protein IPI41_10920 [Flavobacteriales bacterium]|nr:hypothetical protein [Flavobacteriales bacterium]